MYDKTPIELLGYHNSMLFDEKRTGSFLRAILGGVNPGDVVLDIGTGTGILALFACLAGARHVYAVEQGPVLEIARQVVRQNGYQDRITFVRDWSINIKLPERVDVIISETIGNIGIDEGILGWIIDARRRLLSNGGTIIPRRVDLVAAPVESQNDYNFVEDWLKDVYSFDFSAAKFIAANNLLWTELSPESLLSKPSTLATVNLVNVDSEEIHGVASFVIKRDGLIHGIGGWFISELTPGIELSNAPPNRTPSWMHGFLPLDRPTKVYTDDLLIVEVNVKANAAQWEWKVSLDGNSVQEVRSSRTTQIASQTTLAGQLVSEFEPTLLGQKPSRTTEAEVDLIILGLMDGKMTIREIAQHTVERFPTHFTSIENAQERVQFLYEYYGRLRSNAKFKFMEVQ